MATKETQGHKKMMRYLQFLMRNGNFLDYLNNSKKATRNINIARIYHLDSRLLGCLIKLKSGEQISAKDKNFVDMCRINSHSVKESEVYPICISVHPEASKRDVLDFIEKRWKDIEPVLKDKFSGENLKYRRRKLSQEVLDFIWDNRKIPAKEIKKKLKDKFPEIKLAYFEISKVISLEKRQRTGNPKIEDFIKMLEKYEKLT